jgi:DNA-binding CsgD family transcriptional regulator
MAGIQTAPVPIQLQLEPWTLDFWDKTWRPRYPFATDDFSHGLYPTDRQTAERLRYLQLNPHAVKNWLSVDIDHADGALRALWDSHGMVPNLITENPLNGHAHAHWALSEGVTWTDSGRLAPKRLYSAVGEGLRRKTDGDPGYSGLVTKNPLHPDWVTKWLHPNLYELSDLKAALGEFMPPAGWQTRHKPLVGEGRNVSLFKNLALASYRLVRHYWDNSEGFYQALLTAASEANAKFAEPLSDAEVRGIARSVHKWITTESRLWRDGRVAYEAHFIALQSWRGRRSGDVRAAKAEQTKVRVNQVAEQLALLSADGRVTNAQVAEAASVSVRTVQRYRQIDREAEARQFRRDCQTLYAGGLTMTAIGETLGCHRTTVSRALDRLIDD